MRINPIKRILGISVERNAAHAVLIEKGIFSSKWRLAQMFECEPPTLGFGIKENNFHPDEVAVSVPTTELVRPLTLPGSATDKLGQMAKYELQALFPKNVEVACAQAVLGMDQRSTRAVVAAVERGKLHSAMAGMADERVPDAIVTEGLAIYQVLRADGALCGRTAVVYTGESIAAVMFAEDGEIRFLRSYIVSEMTGGHPPLGASPSGLSANPNSGYDDVLSSEIVKMIEHVQKKYAGSGIERLLFVGKDIGVRGTVVAKFTNIKNKIYSHPQIKEPEYLPALGAALSLLPDGLGLNFVSKEERKARDREKTKKTRVALAVLPAILMVLGANFLHLVYQAKERDIAKRVYQAKEDISKIERDLRAVQEVYGENRSIMGMIRENDAALGHNARWSGVLSDLAPLVPSQVTLERISTDSLGGATKEGMADKSTGHRSYAGMATRNNEKPISESDGAGDKVASESGIRKINIEGFAYDFTAVNRFFSNLEGSPRFREVKPVFEMDGDLGGGRISVDERVRFHVEMAVAEMGDMAMKTRLSGSSEGQDEEILVDAGSINYEGLSDEP